MPTESKDYDYIAHEPGMFTYILETPLDELSVTEQFERGVSTMEGTLEAFAHILRPTAVSFRVADVREDGAVHNETVTDDAGVTADSVVDAVQQAAARVQTPRLVQFEITGATRVTLSDGISYVAEPAPDSDYRDEVDPDTDGSPPLEIFVAQQEIMRPCRTERMLITGNSDHWLDTSLNRYSEATPLGEVNQTRLAAAILQLYDTIGPTEFTLKTGENRDGWHVPGESVPGIPSLFSRRSIEWVLENFEQTQQGEDRLTLEYLGEIVHPLISSPNDRVWRFLDEALAPERFEVGATATVVYPDDEVEFEKTPDGWRRNSE